MAYSLPTQSAQEEFVQQREYAELVERVRALAVSVIPEGSVVAVVSKGDPDLLRIEGRVAQHFPRNSTGAYAGYHPADDGDAVGRLEAARGEGTRFLVLPATSMWWLDHYVALARHLDTLYRRVADQPDTAIIFSLDGADAPIEPAGDAWREAVSRNVRSVVAALLPTDARILNAHDLREGSIAELESARRGGAEYLVVAGPAEWLAAHGELRSHLATSCTIVTDQEHACTIYDLRTVASVEDESPVGRTRSGRQHTSRTGGQRRRRRKTDG